MSNLRAAVIAGTHSGVGKTTWSLALMTFFRKKGLTVQPFKVGPDYIDPGFHHLVCRPRKSRNLDRFFLSESYLRNSFEKNSEGADLAVAEGVMGLFDSKSPVTEEGSTAEMAKLLGLPVFLVIDGAGLARSAAALVKGYQTFDPNLHLSGIFINRVGSEGHFRWLREAIEKETSLPVLGWLPKDSEISISERHLGLRTAGEEEKIEEKLNRLAEMLEGRLEEKRFLQSATCVVAGAKVETGFGRPSQDKQGVATAPLRAHLCRIAVAYDRAFSFYYEDNFDCLREAGADIIFFSPLSDSKLPEETDLLYFGGGFPELYAQGLSENESMKESIRKFHREGGMIYAECGGLIYLAEAFMDAQEKKFPWVGLIPGNIRMTDKLQHFGYHEIETLESTFLFPKGKKLRSHEFHYSVLQESVGEDSRSPLSFKIYRIQDRVEGFYDGRLLASYQHLHFGQDPELAKRLVAEIGNQRRKENALS